MGSTQSTLQLFTGRPLTLTLNFDDDKVLRVYKQVFGFYNQASQKISGPVKPVRSVEFLTSPLIKVLVGPEDDRSELRVHQNIISPRSKLFTHAASSEFKTVNMFDFHPELTVADVRFYLETVYTDRVAVRSWRVEYGDICKLYLMAKKMMDVQTRNLALQAMYDRLRIPGLDNQYGIPGWLILTKVYDGTPNAKDPMRRLLVNIWYDHRQRLVLDEGDKKKLPEEFLIEYASVAMRGRPIYTFPITYDMNEYFQAEEKE